MTGTQKPIFLYNSLTREKEEFKPIKKGAVGLYTCGPTVYWFAHIGNLRTYLFEDVLRRVFEYNNYRVKHIMNITDVGHLTSDADSGEDKMEKAAGRENKTVWDIAEFYTEAFKRDLKELNIQPPTKWIKATDHIKEQLGLIQELEKRGFTYQIDDGIYFDTAKLADYGKLAPENIKGIKAGARVEANPQKRSATDFALWKFSPAGSKREMEWKSPWGVGFPGWHIECSAMAMRHLGETFDIHCGGIDHIMIHHTNEIAQSEGATGKKFVNYWLHGNMLVDASGGKMAKSSGEIMTLPELAKKGFNSLAYRYLNLTAHYRTPLQFSLGSMTSAQNGLEHLQAATTELGKAGKVGCAEFENKFHEAINDDLNMPRALAITWDMLISDLPAGAKKTSLLKFDMVLGLGLKNVKALEISNDVEDLVSERNIARKNKDYKTSDEIRQKIESMGFIVKDTADKTEVLRK